MLGDTEAESTRIIANRELREALALIEKHITEENTQQNHDLYQAMQLVADASRRVGKDDRRRGQQTEQLRLSLPIEG